MAFISLTSQPLTRTNQSNPKEKIGFNTDNIVDFKPSNSGGTTIHTVSGIQSVEETFEEVLAKCSESVSI